MVRVAACFDVPDRARLPFALAALLLMAACGGGGGEEPIIRDSTFLSTYRYEILHDADSEAALLLSAQWDGLPVLISARFTGSPGFAGLYDRVAGVTSIAPGSGLIVETSLATPLIGSFRADVTAEIAKTPTGEYSAGAWTVLVGTDSVEVNIDAGVRLSLNGSSPTMLEWPAFAALFAPGSAAPEWQQAASASFQLMRLSALQVNMLYAGLVDAADVSFTNTPGVRSCSPFPDAPPAGVLAQGERALTWLGNANLGFDLQFTDCWVDTAGEAQDYLYRGTATLSGWRAANDRNNRLVFLAFGGDEFGSRVPGGVRYEDLGLAGTTAVGGARELDPAASYAVSGGYAVAFSVP